MAANDDCHVHESLRADMTALARWHHAESYVHAVLSDALATHDLALVRTLVEQLDVFIAAHPTRPDALPLDSALLSAVASPSSSSQPRMRFDSVVEVGASASHTDSHWSTHSPTTSMALLSYRNSGGGVVSGDSPRVSMATQSMSECDTGASVDENDDYDGVFAMTLDRASTVAVVNNDNNASSSLTNNNAINPSVNSSVAFAISTNASSAPIDAILSDDTCSPLLAASRPTSRRSSFSCSLMANTHTAINYSPSAVATNVGSGSSTHHLYASSSFPSASPSHASNASLLTHVSSNERMTNIAATDYTPYTIFTHYRQQQQQQQQQPPPPPAMLFDGTDNTGSANKLTTHCARCQADISHIHVSFRPAYLSTQHTAADEPIMRMCANCAGVSANGAAALANMYPDRELQPTNALKDTASSMDWMALTAAENFSAVIASLLTGNGMLSPPPQLLLLLLLL